MFKFTYNILVSLLLLLIICLAALRKTIEGLNDYKADDLDVIYHTDETKDYNKLLAGVMGNADVIAAFAASTDFTEIKDKIKADPTILLDLKSRLAPYIFKYNTDPENKDLTKAKDLDTLIAKLDASVKATDFVIDKGPLTSDTTVKNFQKLLELVMKKGGDVDNIFNQTPGNSPLLDQIQSKLKKNPELLESPAIRLKKEIDAVINTGRTDDERKAYKKITDDLMEKIAKAVDDNKDKYILKLNITDKLGTVTYNEPGYFRFGPSNYVPNYEDSVYLSRLTDVNWRTPVVDLASQVGNSGAKLSGFCSYNKSNPGQIETECGKLDKTACASTSCCALLGGEKCVAGNENGPTMKSNFSDISIKKRDHYYYQGKCYGNCPDK